jgi:UDP-2,4-diacetamido-2,4,6-trideoxy-beta-L-altropyranose hydrolase
MTAASLLIRADASISTGTGHVMRCLALAQAWQDAGGRAMFATAGAPPAIQARLAAEGCDEFSITAGPGSSSGASQTIALAREHKAGWIVVDGYQFDADYQRLLEAAGCKVLFIDDHGHSSHYCADLVLDQNVHVPASAYAQRSPNTRLLLGARYILLRREFTDWVEWQRPAGSAARKILISMGGSDPDNLTAHALRALDGTGMENLEITVVVGGSNPHGAQLERAAEERKNPIRLVRDIRQMPEIMAGADVAMIAAGGTLWEALFMQCAVLSYGRGRVQKTIVQGLERDGVVVNLGDGADAGGEVAIQALRQVLDSQDWRERLSRKGRALVDGRGSRRVADILLGQETTRE